MKTEKASKIIRNSSSKKRTIDFIKKERTVPDDLRSWRKEYNHIRRQLSDALKSGPKTIPELAELTKMQKADVTYYLMTMRKFGDVVSGEPDELDEYYYYHIKSKGKR